MFESGQLFDRIQREVPLMKIRRVEACRGTERYRVPDQSADLSVPPLRLTVIKDRQTGLTEVLGPPEAWQSMSRMKQVRKSRPARISLTIFGQSARSSESEGQDVEGDDEVVEGDGERRVDRVSHEPDVDVPLTGGPPVNVPRHGPGFMEASPEVREQIRRLHRNLGHPSAERLASFLKTAHGSEESVRAALDFQCDSCLESRQGFEASRPARIHDDVGFNKIVGIDSATWTNSFGEQFRFTHVIDEGTLFHVAAPSDETTEGQIRTFERIWLLWAGPPETVYMDPASGFTSGRWQAFMQEMDAHAKVSVSDAHWQLGRVEVHGGILKKMLDKMHCDAPIRTSDQFEMALTQACNAKNALGRVKGYSPEQGVLGVARRLPASLMDGQGQGSLVLAEGASEESDRFREALDRRCSARKAFVDADNSSSLRRALLRRTRPLRGPCEPGDLVLYWRRKGANLRREHGRWHGPASVVVVEGTRNVWLNHSGKLVRAAPEQLRPASFREWKTLRDMMAKPSWSQPLTSGTFIDLEGDDLPGESAREPDADAEMEPPGSESMSIGEPEREQSAEPPPETSTDPVDVPVPDEDQDLESEADPEESDVLFGDDVEFGRSFRWDSVTRIWEVDVTLSEDVLLALPSAGKDPDAVVLIASDARKRKSEIRISTLSGDAQAKFAYAKNKEIRAWLHHKTVRKVAAGKIPDDSVMRCRWILTWKDANGTEDPRDVLDGKKAKARLVVVGFEDPGVGIVQNDSPTLTKDGRQMIVQQVSSYGWDLISFDVSTAFLHGKGDGRLLGIHPPGELAEALGIGESEQCELVGGAYGRVDAPYLWFCTFRDELLSHGMKQCPLDPCVFSLFGTRPDGTRFPHGSIGIHVDDGIGGGDAEFLRVIEKVRQKYSFGSFDKGTFVFTGIQFKQWDDKSVEFDQIAYLEKIRPVEIGKDRRSQPTASLTPSEVSDLRSIVGALQYAAVHTRPDISARVGELQSATSKGVVQHLLDANKLLFEAKRNPMSLMTLPIDPGQLTICAFSDASFLSGKQTMAHQGSLIFATTPEMLDNQKAVVAPLAWISKKIHRVTRSTLGAESVALSGAVDRMLWLRIFWGWLRDDRFKWQNPEEALQQERKAALVTDCRSAYDLLTRTAVPQCEEHRTTIECLLIRERLQANCQIRWVPSQAQMADCLTKSMDPTTLRMCLKTGRYCLYDEKKVWQERADRKQRSRWLSSMNESACVAKAVEDHWDVSVPGQVIRVHVVPRSRLFTPIGVDCPVDLRQLGLYRKTERLLMSGQRVSDSDFWPGARGSATLTPSWTGRTIFEISRK